MVASLAHPALPKIAVRGIYSPALLQPVAEVMTEIGYTDALVVYGAIDGVSHGMDEASVCGESSIEHLSGGQIETYTIKPEEVGLQKHDAGALVADPDRETATAKMYQLLSGKGDMASFEEAGVDRGSL